MNRGALLFPSARAANEFRRLRPEVGEEPLRGSNIAANEPVIDLKGRQAENGSNVSDGPCLDLAQNPEQAWPTVAFHVFKRRCPVIRVSAIGQLHPLA